MSYHSLYYSVYWIFSIVKQFKIKQKYWFCPTKLILQPTDRPGIIVCKIPSSKSGKFETSVRKTYQYLDFI